MRGAHADCPETVQKESARAADRHAQSQPMRSKTQTACADCLQGRATSRAGEPRVRVAAVRVPASSGVLALLTRPLLRLTNVTSSKMLFFVKPGSRRMSQVGTSTRGTTGTGHLWHSTRGLHSCDRGNVRADTLSSSARRPPGIRSKRRLPS
jgi:hypothetical protein